MASILGKPGGPGQFPTHDLSTVRGALQGLVRRRYVMAPNSVELAARKDIDLTGPGQVLPEEVPRTILVGRRSDETGPPGPGPRVSRASPRGGCAGIGALMRAFERVCSGMRSACSRSR